MPWLWSWQRIGWATQSHSLLCSCQTSSQLTWASQSSSVKLLLLCLLRYVTSWNLQVPHKVAFLLPTLFPTIHANAIRFWHSFSNKKYLWVFFHIMWMFDARMMSIRLHSGGGFNLGFGDLHTSWVQWYIFIQILVLFVRPGSPLPYVLVHPNNFFFCNLTSLMGYNQSLWLKS